MAVVQSQQEIQLLRGELQSVMTFAAVPSWCRTCLTNMSVKPGHVPMLKAGLDL